jgi:hypothetical protein
VFADGSRFVMRLSGTGSSGMRACVCAFIVNNSVCKGATVRLYAERFLAPDAKDLFGDAQEVCWCTCVCCVFNPFLCLDVETSDSIGIANKSIGTTHWSYIADCDHLKKTN